MSPTESLDPFFFFLFVTPSAGAPDAFPLWARQGLRFEPPWSWPSFNPRDSDKNGRLKKSKARSNNDTENLSRVRVFPHARWKWVGALFREILAG